MIRKLLFFVAFVFMLNACASIRLSSSEGLSAEEHISLGNIYEAKGSLDLALAEYVKAIDADDANDAAWFAAGNVELRRSRFSEAAQYYKKAVELRPLEAAYHNNLGWLYMETSNLAQAEKEVRAALALDPSHGYIYLDSLGVIAMRKGEYKAAEQYFNDAVKGLPVDDLAGANEISVHLKELNKLTGGLESNIILEDKTSKGNK